MGNVILSAGEKLGKIKVEFFFLTVAAIVNVFYICHFSNLSNYYHGSQTFLHVVHLAYSLDGEPDTLPVSFLELVYRNEPNISLPRGTQPNPILLVASNACQWSLEIANRYCYSSGSMHLPVSFEELLAIPLNPGRVFNFSTNFHSSLYSPVGYIAFIAGTWAGIAAQLPPLVIMYMAIGFNMAAALALGFYTIKIFPILRWLVCYLLLLPTCFTIRSFIMPDALLIESCLLMLGLALRFSAEGTCISRRQLCSIIGLSLWIGLIKTAYCLTPLIFVIVPSRLFGGDLRKIAAVGLAFAASVGASLLWGLYLLAYVHKGAPANPSFGLSLSILKLENILRLRVFLRNLEHIINYHWLRVGIANFFTWNKEWLKGGWEYALVMSTTLLLLFEKTSSVSVNFIGMTGRIASGCIFLGSFFFIFIAMCFYYHASAMQGRYFLPALPFLLMAFYPVFSFRYIYQLWCNRITIALAIGTLLWLNIMQFRV